MNIYNLDLRSKPFENIKNGKKSIELRLYYKNYTTIKTDDIIKFYKLPDRKEKLTVKVLELLRYSTFEEMFDSIDYNLAGPADSKEEKLNNIHKIYNKGMVKTYGVLGIRLAVIE